VGADDATASGAARWKLNVRLAGAKPA